MLMVFLAVVLSGCSGPSTHTTTAPPAASATSAAPTATLGRPFTVGSFEVTVTRVELGVSVLHLAKTAEDAGVKPFTPDNGMFLRLHLTATNTGTAPATMSTLASTITDDKGRTFSSGRLYLGGLDGQGLDTEQQPGTTRAGFVVFDVPSDVTRVVVAEVQPDDTVRTPPVRVALG